MYICQDKCYRLVPKEDHHFAQREDYVFGARFCAICCVIIRRGSEAYNQMVLDRWTNGGLWECPCCKARPRQYFDLQTKQKEYLLQKMAQSRFFEQIAEHFFSLEPQKDKTKQLIDSIRHVLSDPQYASPHKSPKEAEQKLTMYPSIYKAVEISMFPQ